VGFIGGGAAESFDPGQAGVSGYIGAARDMAMYDRLSQIRPDLSGVDLMLAESFEPNSDNTEWTIRLKSGIEFHDGKSLTADDVIYTIRRAAKDPAHGAYVLTQPMKVKELQKMDELTVRIPLNRAIAELQDSFFTPYGWGILQDGTTDFTKPVGTGPFMFDSFTPGQSGLLKKNPNYWQSGVPYLDELEFQSIPDENARYNALLSGELDAISDMSYAHAKEQQASGAVNVLEGKGPSCVYITMAVDLKPFDDKRVRQAMRLIADREELVNNVQLGFGAVGNDLFGAAGVQYFADDIPQRTQDIEQAKSLLKQAGAEDLRVTLYSSTWGPGMLESATVFAEQAKAAGVTIDVNNSPADTYLTNKYLKVNFGQSYAGYYPLGIWYNLQLVTGGIWNETHWNFDSFDQLVFDAQGESDPGKAQEKYTEAQQIIWDEGGNLIWGTLPFEDGLAKNVRGAEPSGFLALSSCDFRNYWLA
jgi:peptide/nickel transport system substrate-binding protein